MAKKKGARKKTQDKGLEQLQKWLEESKLREIEKADTSGRYASLKDLATRQLITGRPLGGGWVLLPDGKVWHPSYGYGRLLSTGQGVMLEPLKPTEIKGALPQPYRGGEIVGQGTGEYLGADPRQVKEQAGESLPQPLRGELTGQGTGEYLGPDPRQVRQERLFSRPALPPPQDVIEGKIIKYEQQVRNALLPAELPQAQITQKTPLWQRLVGGLKNAKVPRIGWTGIALTAIPLAITAYDLFRNRDKAQQSQQKPEQPNQEQYQEIYKALQNMPQQHSSQQPKPKQPAKPNQVKQPSQTIEQEQKQEQTTQPQTENVIQENQNLLMQANQSLQQGNDNAYLNALERLVSNHEKFIENVISQQNELITKMTEILTRPLPDTPKFGPSELEQNLRTITQSLVMIASLFAPSDRVPFYVGMVNGMMQAWREKDMDDFKRQLTEYKLNLEKDLRERDMQLKATALGMEQLGRNIGFADRSFQLRWELVQSQWKVELEREKRAMELQKELAKRVWDMEKMFLQHELKLREIEKRGEVQEELTKLRASLRPPKIGRSSGSKPPKPPRINSEILNRALYQANQYGLRGDAEGMKNLLNTLQNSYNITDYERQLIIQQYQQASQKRK